ncbi:MAG TPA: ATP-binding protein [Gemmatimonadaceae bacterium]
MAEPAQTITSPPDAILPRAAEHSLDAAGGVSPVIVVMGARQTGKSTLVRTLAPYRDRPYFSLDELDIRGQAQSDPDALVRRAPRITLDEVQRVPDLLLAIKRAVDEAPRRTPGRFVLTGSANLLTMRRVSESLAGRASYVTLWPLTHREQLGSGTTGMWEALLSTPSGKWFDIVRDDPTPAMDWRELAFRGGLPTPAHWLPSAEQRTVWWRGYVQTYLERDLRDLTAVENLADFRRLMRAVCLRLGSLVNQTELGRDIGMAQPQVHRYLNLLETSFQLVRLPAYAVNRTKRLIKTPKAYWSDTGLALFLAGEPKPGGAHLENIILTDLIAWRDAHSQQAEILYWRTATGQEVDFVVERGERLLPIEVKATKRPSYKAAANITAFMQEYPEKCDGGLLLHCGSETEWLAEGVLAAPWWKVV